jgi:conjugal transfer/type IV secretion protein DotA/TraY
MSNSNSNNNFENKAIGVLKKIPGFILIPANPFKVMGSISSLIVKDTVFVKGTIKKAFSVEKPSEEENKLLLVNDYQKRFRMSMNMNKTSNSDLPKIIKNIETNFYVYFFLLGLSICYAFLAPKVGFGGHSGYMFFNLLSRCFLIPPLLAFTIKTSFQLYQLRAKALMPFKYWLRDPGAWFGAQPKSMSTILTICLVGFSIFFGLPHIAEAQTVTGSSGNSGIDYLFTKLNSNDLSLQWLQGLFPAAVDMFNGNTAGATTASTDLFQSLFQILNSVLLAVASGVLAYQIFSGTVHTAHTGKVLGEQYHQVWAPIRVAAGFGLLFPVNGYCVAQLLAIQILLAGYGLANGVWTTYVGEVIGNTSAYNGTSGSSTSTTTGTSAMAWQIPASQQQQIVNQVISAAACAKYLSLENNGAASVDTNGQPLYVLNVPNSTSTTSPSWNFGTACGSFTIDVSPPTTTTTNTGPSSCSSSTSGLITEHYVVPGSVVCANTSMATATSTFDQAKISAFNTLVSSVQGNTTLINNIVNQEMSNQATSVNSSTVSGLTTAYSSAVGSSGAGSTYIAAVATAANTFLNSANSASTTAFQNMSTEMGWAVAGSEAELLNNYTQQAYQLVIKSLPNFTAGATDSLESSEVTGLGNIQSVINGASQTLNPLSLSTNQDNQSPSTDPSTIADKVMSKIFQGVNGATLSNYLSGTFKLNPVNPVGDIQQFGDNLLDIAYVALGIWVAIQAAAAFTGSGIVGGTVAKLTGWKAMFTAALASISFLVKALIGGMFVLGIVDAIIVPMTFYIIWLFAIISCISFAIEFIIAAPFWAFMHIKMQGNELLNQEQKGGYQMLFSAAFRPTILLFSLIASSLLFSVAIGYLNTTFGAAFISARGNSTIGIISLLAELTMLVYLHFQIAMKSLALITQGPALVAQFLGTQDQGRGEQNEADRSRGVVAGFVRTGVGQGTGAVGTYGQAQGQLKKQAEAQAQEERRLKGRISDPSGNKNNSASQPNSEEDNNEEDNNEEEAKLGNKENYKDE